MNTRNYNVFLKGFNLVGQTYEKSVMCAVRMMGDEVKLRFKTLSWYDCGYLVGMCFKHRPNDGFLEELTGVKKGRY